MRSHAFHFGKTAAYGEQLRHAALGNPKFAVFNLCEQRNMSRQDADFTPYGRDDDGIDRVGKDPCFRGDDFED